MPARDRVFRYGARQTDAHRPTRSRRGEGRSYAGFTLLEIAVTLAILALAATLVVPTLWRPAEAPGDELAAVVARGRGVAVQRAQALVLRIEPSGEWRLTTAERGVSVGEGRLSAGITAGVALHYTPLGACVAEMADGVFPDLDALRCAPRRSPSP